jgi:hypothetical protein
MSYLSLSVITSFIVYLAYYTIILGCAVEAKTDNPSPITQQNNEIPKLPSLWFKGIPVRRFKALGYPQITRENVPPPALEFDTFDDSNDFDKRFDDYGHLRFGKRDNFDDYGHMR